MLPTDASFNPYQATNRSTCAITSRSRRNATRSSAWYSSSIPSPATSVLRSVMQSSGYFRRSVSRTSASWLPRHESSQQRHVDTFAKATIAAQLTRNLTKEHCDRHQCTSRGTASATVVAHACFSNRSRGIGGSNSPAQAPRTHTHKCASPGSDRGPADASAVLLPGSSAASATSASETVVLPGKRSANREELRERR